MPKISVIMPVYNVEKFVSDAVRSVLDQSFEDFELLIIDDQSPDNSIRICEKFRDQRIHIIRHAENRGLAGARNTGIREARGKLLAFIDSDDCWHPDKLKLHVRHLEADPELGVSFSRSAFINADGTLNACFQMPRLSGLTPEYYLCRNPIGNGSAPVIRRAVFEAIRFTGNLRGVPEDCYFDEHLRQSEDIECWIRIALTTEWKIEGIPEALTYYRLNEGGLSANLFKQLGSWEQAIDKTRTYAPEFIAKWESKARSYQYRYLARQAIRLRDGEAAIALVWRALRMSPKIVSEEPARTAVTFCAAAMLYLAPTWLYSRLEDLARFGIGRAQSWRIRRDLTSRASRSTI